MKWNKSIRGLGRGACFFAGAAAVSLVVGALVDGPRIQPLGWSFGSAAERQLGTANEPRAPEQQDRVMVISLAEAVQWFDRKGALFLDAQPSLFFSMRRIPGALNLSREDFDDDYRRLEREIREWVGPILVYCSDEQCEDSARVAGRLAALGFPEIIVYRGGIEEWEAAGMPVETDD
jgi:rhodanese-related sulfurtransferase